MTVTGSGAEDDATRVDRQPPSFPSVGDNQNSSASPTSSAAPLFADAPAASAAPETSQITSRPIDPPSSRGGGRLRWLVAGLATVLVIALVGGALVLAAPRAGAASATAHYAPADTGMYAEIRLDMPGDQHDNLAEFMSHFPGFADQASFDQKFDEMLNSLLARRSSGISWTEDVKPWFGGQVALFGDAKAPKPDVNQDGSTAAMHDGVVVLTVADKAKLQSVIDAHIGSATVTSEDYSGTQIKTVSPADNSENSAPTSYAITDDALLVAPDAGLIKQALDVKSGQSKALADDDFFTQQLAALHADRLATFYFSSASVAAAMPAETNLPAQCAALFDTATKMKIVGEARAEKDHLSFTTRALPPTGDAAPPLPPNRQSKLAESMPSDTVAYLEMHGVGANVTWLIKHALPCASASGSTTGPLPSGLGNLGNIGDMSQIFEQFLGAQPEDYFDFVDDAAVGMTYTNDTLRGGLVATVNDQAVATQRVDKLLSLIKLFGSGFGSFGGDTGGSMPQITTEEIDHNGTKVTVITVAPKAPGQPPTSLQVAVANGRMYLGVDDFVTAALDRSAAESLASNAKYQQATSGAPADNAAIAFVDMSATADLYGERLSSSSQDFQTNMAPFLETLSSLSMVSHVDNGMVVSNGFLFVE